MFPSTNQSDLHLSTLNTIFTLYSPSNFPLHAVFRGLSHECISLGSKTFSFKGTLIPLYSPLVEAKWPNGRKTDFFIYDDWRTKFSLTRTVYSFCTKAVVDPGFPRRAPILYFEPKTCYLPRFLPKSA